MSVFLQAFMKYPLLVLHQLPLMRLDEVQRTRAVGVNLDFVSLMVLLNVLKRLGMAIISTCVLEETGDFTEHISSGSVSHLATQTRTAAPLLYPRWRRSYQSIFGFHGGCVEQTTSCKLRVNRGLSGPASWVGIRCVRFDRTSWGKKPRQDMTCPLHLTRARTSKVLQRGQPGASSKSLWPRVDSRQTQDVPYSLIASSVSLWSSRG